MKYITDLSEDEVLKLSQEELEKMVKWKMAQDGIKFYLKPEEPEYHEIPEPDMTYYKVGGFEYLFPREDSALALSKVINQFSGDLRKEGWRDDKVEVLEDYYKRDLGSVSAVRKYSSELWNQIAGLKNENETNKSNFNKLMSDYEEAYKSADYIRDEVYGRFNEVTQKYADFSLALVNFNTYLEIANGDHGQALKFFEKAYNPNTETIAYIKKMAFPQKETLDKDDKK